MTKAMARRCLANVLYIRHASSRTPDSGFMAVMVQPGSADGVEAGDLNCGRPCASPRSGGEPAVHRDRGAAGAHLAVPDRHQQCLTARQHDESGTEFGWLQPMPDALVTGGADRRGADGIYRAF